MDDPLLIAHAGTLRSVIARKQRVKLGALHQDAPAAIADP
jgi:hypothetical protein